MRLIDIFNIYKIYIELFSVKSVVFFCGQKTDFSIINSLFRKWSWHNFYTHSLDHCTWCLPRPESTFKPLVTISYKLVTKLEKKPSWLAYNQLSNSRRPRKRATTGNVECRTRATALNLFRHKRQPNWREKRCQITKYCKKVGGIGHHAAEDLNQLTL